MGRAETGTRFNVFRRFRETVLQRSEARQILIDYWMGHSNTTMADRYGRQLVKDVEYRQDQVSKVDWDLKSQLRCLGYVGYALLRFTQQLNE